MIRQAIYDLIDFISLYVHIPILIIGVLTTLWGLQSIRGGQYMTENRVSHQPIQRPPHRYRSGPVNTSRYSGGDATARGRGFIIGGIIILICGLGVIALAILFPIIERPR